MKVSNAVPWATLMIGALVLIAAGVGGAVVIWGHDGALSFDKYLDLLKNFALAVGILGVGRGIVSYGRSAAEASKLSDTSLLSTGPPTDEWRSSLNAADVENYPPPEPGDEYVPEAGPAGPQPRRPIDG